MQGEATRITLFVTQTLEQIGILYAVGGSFASSLHGVMRSTLDLAYLRKWANDLKVTDLLERAFKEMG